MSARDVEADTLAADISALIRMVYRLKQDAHRHGVWLHLEGAALDLAAAKRGIDTPKRKRIRRPSAP
ncbi:MAG: hypothetical protein ACOY5W_09080 [Pseudomonadota bacterium]